MLKIENTTVWGFEHAIRGMRNPMNSWVKSDSGQTGRFVNGVAEIYIGPNDLKLMRQLYKAGPEHRKYLRQIFVSMDITAPLYWWKEFDTYKVGTVSNSCSTMHKIAEKPFKLNDFSCEHLNVESRAVMIGIVTCLNEVRDNYRKSGDKEDWWQMIQLLPSSYNQKRTITMTYENVASIIHQRAGHKLDEWRWLVNQMTYLPYAREIMGDIEW